MADTTARFQTYDPGTGQVVASFVSASADDINQTAERARVAATRWRGATPEQRSKALLGVAALLRDGLERCAALEASDTGKPLAAARGEVAGAIQLWEYAAALARTDSAQSFSGSLPGGLALTLREPLGTVGMIVPWNYPLITTSERLPFALAAGNAVILKPSELAAGALPWLVESIAKSSLFPPDLLQAVHGEGKVVGQALCHHPDIDMIAFVGSTPVGRAIESAATAHGKRVASELGGSNFVLIYADADLDRAAREVIRGALRNGGQACIAGAHVLVAPAVREPFLQALQQALQHAYPLDAAGQAPAIQPMITPQHRQRIAALIDHCHAQGWPLLPGSTMTGQGNRIGPAIFTDVPPDHPLLKEEIFGPLVTITTAPETDFIRIANASGYGLAGYAWTRANATALQVARELRAGRIWINADPDHWLPELPVGGFGQSGTGRELGPMALDTYALPKSVMLSSS